MVSFYNLRKSAVVLLTFILTDSFGQEIPELEIPKSQIKFSGVAMLYDNIKIFHWKNEILKSKPCYSGEITINYQRLVKNNFFLNFGIGIGLAPYNLNFYISDIENEFINHNFLDFNDYDYFSGLHIFPISLQKIIKNKKKENKFYNIEFGVKDNRVVAYPYLNTTGLSSTLKNVNRSSSFFRRGFWNDNIRNIPSIFIKTGLIKLTKKQNTLNLNLVANYSPYYIGLGWYEFYFIDTPSYGSLYQNINYIGFEFSYGIGLWKQ